MWRQFNWLYKIQTQQFKVTPLLAKIMNIYERNHYPWWKCRFDGQLRPGNWQRKIKCFENNPAWTQSNDWLAVGRKWMSFYKAEAEIICIESCHKSSLCFLDSAPLCAGLKKYSYPVIYYSCLWLHTGNLRSRLYESIFGIHTRKARK